MAGLLINRTKRLRNQQFYSEVTPKKNIFWHHTGGTTAEGAINWWNQTPEPIGTAYVIDRDGTPYEVFDPQCWAWGLGVGNKTLEKQSIQIELVSAGQLILEKGNYYFAPLFPNMKGRIEIPADEVCIFETPYKGYKFFQKYTDKQIDTLMLLTKQLIKDFGITVQDNLKDFWLLDPKVSAENRGGLYAHTTVLNYKTDIFPQPNLIDLTYKNFAKPAKKEPKQAPELQGEVAPKFDEKV